MYEIKSWVRIWNSIKASGWAVSGRNNTAWREWVITFSWWRDAQWRSPDPMLFGRSVGGTANTRVVPGLCQESAWATPQTHCHRNHVSCFDSLREPHEQYWRRIRPGVSSTTQLSDSSVRCQSRFYLNCITLLFLSSFSCYQSGIVFPELHKCKILNFQ